MKGFLIFFVSCQQISDQTYMCTVTFLYKGDNQFTLTSNRDEAPARKTSSPNIYNDLGIKMVYPKDELAGGTWIGASEQQRVVCLLNGAFELHQRKLPYRKSRGLVVKEFLAASDILLFCDSYDFDNIEPFTIVLVDWNDCLKLIEIVWDGKEKHQRDLPLTAHIWSSSTLYTDEMKAMREDWFVDFKMKGDFRDDAIFNFHESAGNGDITTDVLMNRVFVRTVSITQIKKNTNDIAIRYKNILTNEISNTNLQLKTSWSITER